jgi:hypothetical protein
MESAASGRTGWGSAEEGGPCSIPREDPVDLADESAPSRKHGCFAGIASAGLFRGRNDLPSVVASRAVTAHDAKTVTEAAGGSGSRVSWCQSPHGMIPSAMHDWASVPSYRTTHAVAHNLHAVRVNFTCINELGPEATDIVVLHACRISTATRRTSEISDSANGGLTLGIHVASPHQSDERARTKHNRANACTRDARRR